jgi:hypothetical protein
MTKTNPIPWPNNSDGNPIGAFEYIIALIDENNTLKERLAKAYKEIGMLRNSKSNYDDYGQ